MCLAIFFSLENAHQLDPAYDRKYGSRIKMPRVYDDDGHGEPVPVEQKPITVDTSRRTTVENLMFQRLRAQHPALNWAPPVVDGLGRVRITYENSFIFSDRFFKSCM